jgi:hypothetical protein
MGTLLAGARRIGKTTVCQAACGRLADEGLLVIKIDVPERHDSAQLLQQFVDTCAALKASEPGKRVLRALRPTVEKLLTEQGVPIDLSGMTAEERQGSARTIVGLPTAVAQAHGRRVVVFLDELQRVTDYEDGLAVLTDLIDLYTGSADAVVLVDGSDERTIRDLLGSPMHLGKLVDRLDLPPTIPAATWREPLTHRFAVAGLRLDDEHRDRIIDWGRGKPYDTMAAARYTAFSARKLNSDSVTEFDVQMGIDEATRHLDDDGA